MMIVMIALALAMDAFAVSVASGIVIRTNRLKRALLIAGSFGFFQFFMPLIGWLGGVYFSRFSKIDHWIAFALLTFVGIKMIYEAFKIEDIEKKTDPTKLYVLLVLSVATSIDALAAGFSFAFLDIAIIAPVIVIGVITFALSFIGVMVGAKIGHFVETKIEVLGGIILILIGIKILYDHISA